ncbi:HK97-gp10 family putative phage morphogenesis protein [Sutcliffiella halmapala]
MPLPKSVTKIKKEGVEFISNVDKVQYTLAELSRAALRDTAKFLRKRLTAKYRALPGMKRSRRVYKSTQYWLRRKESDLVIGHKHDTWYGARSELGSHGQPARNILRETVYENINEIRKIQGQYLSAIESENRAMGLIDETETKSGDGPE